MASNGSFSLECDAISAAMKYWVVYLRQIVCSQFSERVILRDGDFPWPPKSLDLSTWDYFCVST